LFSLALAKANSQKNNGGAAFGDGLPDAFYTGSYR
jgi:hypothetical protein